MQDLTVTVASYSITNRVTREISLGRCPTIDSPIQPANISLSRGFQYSWYPLRPLRNIRQSSVVLSAAVISSTSNVSHVCCQDSCSLTAATAIVIEMSLFFILDLLLHFVAQVQRTKLNNSVGPCQSSMLVKMRGQECISQGLLHLIFIAL